MLAPTTDRSHTPKGRRAREQIVAAAEELFGTHGFHGASMRDLAGAAGLPLATVVYHFARKEQLYAAVLGAIGDELVADLTRVEAGDPADALDRFALMLVRWTVNRPIQVRLLLRELLDNPGRVARAAQLPLAPFLTQATALVAAAVRAGISRVDYPELAVLHLVGGISYVVTARPTVDRIVGKPRAKQLAAGYERDALAFARRVLDLHKESPHAR